MKYRKWLVGWLMVCSQYAVGQRPFVPDTVRVDELKRNFYHWAQGADTLSRDCPDRVAFPADRVPPIRIWEVARSRCGFSLDSDSRDRLHRAGKVQLPAACWFLSSDGGGGTTLFWRGLRAPVSSGVDSVALRRQLSKRYGTKPEQGVPARWFSGTVGMTALFHPYCNNRVCMDVAVQVFRKGTSEGDPVSLRMKPGRLSIAHFYQDKLYYRPYKYPELTYYFGHSELDFFSRLLYGLVPRDSSYTGRQDFALLLYVDTSGKARFHTLLPDCLTAEETHCLDVLNRAMEQLPEGLFGHLLTTDGRIFPARYLNALYRPETGGWAFIDYLFRDTFRPLGTGSEKD